MRTGIKLARQFLHNFQQFEHWLRTRTNNPKWIPFPKLLDQVANQYPEIRYHLKELNTFNDLRNSIAHSPGSNEGDIIALPLAKSVRQFGELINDVKRPPQLKNMKGAMRRVNVFLPNVSVGSMIGIMAKKKHSQEVVRSEGQLTILTSEDLFSWLSIRLKSSGDFEAIHATKIESLLRRERRDFAILPSCSNVYEAKERFIKGTENGELFWAIIITPDGKATEDPVGILTPWDLKDWELP